MNDIITVLNLINDAIFTSLVNTTLQMTILIPVVALIIWVFRIKSVNTRYSLWLFVLLAIIILPFVTPIIPHIDFARFHTQGSMNNMDNMMLSGSGNGDNSMSKNASTSTASANTTKMLVNRESDIPLINPVSVAYFLWCAGAFFMAFITISAFRGIARMKKACADVDDPDTLDMLSRLKQRIGVNRPVMLKVSSETYTPVSLGVFSYTLILPITCTCQDDLEMILTHELAHIKRHDYLINLIQNVLMVIFFFHPLFHLLSRNLAKEREHICDDWVIDVTEQRGVYAECIVGLLEKALHKPVNIPVVIAMAERKRDIPGRIGMIVDRSRKLSTRLSRKALVVMLIIGCLSLPVIGGVELVRFAMAKPAPSEGWIIFSKSGQGKDGIWVMDADGKNEKQLTYGINDGSSVWSPDGRQIAFFRYTDDPNLRDIYIMDADGSDIKRLTEGPENDVNPTWSPDGKRIVFERSIWDKKDNNWEMKSWAFCVMDSNGSNIRILVEQPAKRDPNWGLRGGGDPELSPDGQKIAYYYWAVDRPALHVMDADGKNPKMLHRWGADAGIDWSPDGSKIAFASCQDSWMTWQSNDIYVINADGTDLKILTKPGPPWYSGIAWSPDGARIAFCSDLDKPGGTYDIYVMNADGSNVQRLTNTPEYEWVSDWTASSYAVEPAGKLKSTWGKIKERMGY